MWRGLFCVKVLALQEALVHSELLLGSTSWDQRGNVTMWCMYACVLGHCSCASFKVLMQKRAFSCTYTTWRDSLRLIYFN